MKKQLMKASKYRENFFCDGSKPALSTIRRWIDNGDLPGERIGGVYYVNIGQLSTTGNPLVDSVLKAS
ncbi:DNA-binding protein [Marinobacterium rhizophilum]|uniref:DNA-binding protein n=1 Tax=Marinobacterium rhizophilum TaxID=420402 RepID=UPI0003632946|nr:DNA-binding protein [Marinobacterium rhizophilum]